MRSEVHIATWTLEAQQVVCPILAADCRVRGASQVSDAAEGARKLES